VADAGETGQVIAVRRETGQLGGRRDSSYLVGVHDWQVIPECFFGKRSYALLEARLCKNRKAGKNTLIDGMQMLSQDCAGRCVKVRPRGRVLTPGLE